MTEMLIIFYCVLLLSQIVTSLFKSYAKREEKQSRNSQMKDTNKEHCLITFYHLDQLKDMPSPYQSVR